MISSPQKEAYPVHSRGELFRTLLGAAAEALSSAGEFNVVTAEWARRNLRYIPQNSKTSEEPQQSA